MDAATNRMTQRNGLGMTDGNAGNQTNDEVYAR